jgi:hypothetical protein
MLAGNTDSDKVDTGIQVTERKEIVALPQVLPLLQMTPRRPTAQLDSETGSPTASHDHKPKPAGSRNPKASPRTAQESRDGSRSRHKRIIHLPDWQQLGQSNPQRSELPNEPLPDSERGQLTAQASSDAQMKSPLNKQEVPTRRIANFNRIAWLLHNPNANEAIARHGSQPKRNFRAERTLFHNGNKYYANNYSVDVRKAKINTGKLLLSDIATPSGPVCDPHLLLVLPPTVPHPRAISLPFRDPGTNNGRGRMQSSQQIRRLERLNKKLLNLREVHAMPEVYRAALHHNPSQPALTKRPIIPAQVPIS